MIKLNLARLVIMAVYLAGLGIFIYAEEYTKALMLLAVIYWTNVAWYQDGLLKIANGLLKEASDIMTASIKSKRTSVEENDK